MSLSHQNFEQKTSQSSNKSKTDKASLVIVDLCLDWHDAKAKSYISFEQIKLVERIDSGASGTIYKAIWNNSTVAIKEMARTSRARKEKDFLEKLTEMHAPNIIKFLGYNDDTKFYLAMDYMPEGCLADYVNKYNVPINITYSFMIDIATAVNFLHQEKILHRDIKGANVLVNKNYQAILADFGSAIYEDEKQEWPAGTSRWMAPEVLLSQPASKASDIYSTAVTFWEIKTTLIPYTNIDDENLALEVAIKGYREPLTCHSELANIIEKAWDPKPEKRPTATELLANLNLFAKKNNVKINNNNNNNANKSIGMTNKNN